MARIAISTDQAMISSAVISSRLSSLLRLRFVDSLVLLTLLFCPRLRLPHRLRLRPVDREDLSQVIALELRCRGVSVDHEVDAFASKCPHESASLVTTASL